MALACSRVRGAPVESSYVSPADTAPEPIPLVLDPATGTPNISRALSIYGEVLVDPITGGPDTRSMGSASVGGVLGAGGVELAAFLAAT